MIENDEKSLHPDDNELTAYALGEKADFPVAAHCMSCPACSRQVVEIRSIRSAIENLPEQDLPILLSSRIGRAIRIRRWPLVQKISLSLNYLLKNPFVLLLGLIFSILFFYIFFVFVL